MQGLILLTVSPVLVFAVLKAGVELQMAIIRPLAYFITADASYIEVSIFNN